MSILSCRWESRGRSYGLFNALGYQFGDMDPNLCCGSALGRKASFENCLKLLSVHAYVGFRKGIQHWHDISRDAAAADFAKILDTLGTHIAVLGTHVGSPF